MAIRTRVDAIDRDVDLIISSELSKEAQSRRLAQFAREELARGEARNRQALGYQPPHEAFVDGRQGVPLETVRPDGVIVFEFDLIETALAAVAELLVMHSPVLTGRYQDSHILLADGVEVEPGNIPAASEYVFVNAQPYARKLERGLSPQAPDGVYQAVAALASRRFGNLARIRFTFRSLLSDYIPGGRGRAGLAALRGQSARLSAMRMERASRQPAIAVTL